MLRPRYTLLYLVRQWTTQVQIKHLSAYQWERRCQDSLIMIKLNWMTFKYNEIRHIEASYFLKICKCLTASEADVERLFSYLRRATGSYLRQSLAIDTYKWLCYVKIHDNSKLNELYVDEEDI
ncbi:Conserved_hypothetical protein [Hexamita inflata]|uniref:HAT C-terminal dimerisation domain-containing protein n=1 Tax=Hexamita inflata TaxID=28002 RepID=A0ABP1GP57_9EUKA